MTAESQTAAVRLDSLDALIRSSIQKEPTFSEPWMARAFGLTLALSERGLFSLGEFQSALIDSVNRQERKGDIADDVEYYTCWLEALLTLLRQRSPAPEQRLSAQMISTVEKALIIEVAGRKEHQHQLARHPDGTLKIEPIVVA
jgi:nitrile hydratase accessory protein